MKPNSARLFYFSAVTVASLTLFLNCTKEIGVVPDVPPPPPGKCDTITYAKHIKRLTGAHCERCHNDQLQNGNYNLTTYAAMKEVSDLGKLHNVIFVSGPKKMPYDSTNVLTDAEKESIQCWIDNGEKP